MIPKPQRDDHGKVQGEFYPLQKAELIALRKAKLINNSAYVHFALRYENPYCDRSITIIPKEFATRWQIPESSVYEAIAKLKDSNTINIKSGRITIEWANSQQAEIVENQQADVIDSQQVNNSGNPEKFWESRKNSGNPEKFTESQKNLRNPRKNSGSSENCSPEPSPSKGSNSPQTIQTYSDLKNSLSDGERESFLKFGLEKARKLPKPPELPHKWIETHWEEISAEWMKVQGKIPEIQKQKWKNHPYRDEWLEKIRSLGQFGFYAENRQEEKERREFFKWADANNLIWGQS
ncbi:hypothetical protein Cylst_6587 (plasmid) [Cylindrospermum stagnale PCC 7417]|uniref:Uncharacterized protein n=1 Tax=Cylindrospermum stagnale PCC 7417 TaxID=56107 RepID=K9X788_9NOST|nr:hypothetical protein [Cylindrospermum stagnale]AFZ28358.1 hypothetical protein Cylst_6587 [Cylindrospermum stagnale PCC 7417]